MILRESDAGAWTADPGGTLEQRRYYCQNWRSDTSVVLTDTGKMVESVKFSSYGVPFAMPAGDTDSDGDWDATDDGVIAADVPNTDARRDTDLDGDVDAADITQANGAKSGYYSTGRGILSAVSNRKGYAGYESASEFEGANRHLSHIRNRDYDADLGRWTRRDPLGYVDGMGLYEYGDDHPMIGTDPAGLMRLPCPTGSRECDDCRECEQAKALMDNDPVIKDINTWITKHGCPLPIVECTPDMNSNGEEVFTNCTSPVKIRIHCGIDRASLIFAITHEYIHALDECALCKAGQSNTSCTAIVCSEARAYYYSRRKSLPPADREQCVIDGVRRSVCGTDR